MDLGRELGAVGFAREEGEGVGVRGGVVAGRESGDGAGVKRIGKGDGGVGADGFQFVAVNADGLSDFWKFFKGGDDDVETAVAIEVGGGGVAAILREGDAEEVGYVDEVCAAQIEEKTISFVTAVGVICRAGAGELLAEVGFGEGIFPGIADVNVVQPKFGFVIVSGGAGSVTVGDVEIWIAIEIEIGGGAAPGPARPGDLDTNGLL